MNIIQKVDILLIEDNPGDARLVSEILKEIRMFTYNFKICETLKEGIDFLKVNTADVILLDLNLPDSNGQDTFEILHSTVPDIPIILVSGLGDEELSLKLIQHGAQDFINKGEASFRVFEKSISYSLERNKLRASLEQELKSRIIAENEIQNQNSILNAIINNSHSVIIFLLDRNYKYLGFNENHRKEMRKIYGVEIAQGLNLLELIPIPEIRGKAKISIDRVLRGETFIDIDIQPEFNIYYEFHWNVVRKGGDIIGASCFIIDITERQLAIGALRASEGKFRVLVETAMSGIYISNLSGDLLFANDAFCDLLGYRSLDELNKIGISNTYENISDRDTFIDKLKQQHRVVNYKLSLISKTGKVITAMFSAYLEGDLITGTVIDISELVQAKERAEMSDRLKTAFMNNISHEIRTPLNGILGFSDMIRQPGLTSEEMSRFHDFIYSSSQRLLNTIINYMDISLIASGSMEIRICNVEPDYLLQTLKDKFHGVAVSKNLQLILIIPEKTRSTILNTDAELLIKALSHLLDNAVKFSNEGQITFGYTLKSGSMEFFVQDTGIGISKEAQSMVFSSFAQEELSDTRGYEGSGLGLSIAQGMVRLLGGDISLESEKGKGSRFSFTLIPGGEGQAIPERDLNINKKTSLRKPLILIAEDDESNMIYLEILLNQRDIKVITASNGKEAIACCHDHPEISLVLMDLKMPIIDGLEATKEIKSFREDLPIIVVTAFAMSGDENKAREAGCDDYLSKPVKKELLFEKLKKFTVV